jgi:hypothetical protein
MNRDAIMPQKERILNDTQKTPMKAATLVAGAAQGSMGFRLSIVGVSEVVWWECCVTFKRQKANDQGCSSLEIPQAEAGHREGALDLGPPVKL